MRGTLHRFISTAGTVAYDGVMHDWKSFCELIKRKKTKPWTIISSEKIKIKATDEHVLHA